jgi:serine phosphatase RsbU (regulator of sigma subunit)
MGAHDSSDRYCTLALASIKTKTHGGAKLTVALGGHPHPLIVRRHGPVEQVGVPGQAVGWFSGGAFTDVATELSPGDVLLMFTDGMLEAVCGHGSMDDSALRQLLRPLAGCTAAQVADRLDAALGEGVLTDDAAFLVIQAL